MKDISGEEQWFWQPKVYCNGVFKLLVDWAELNIFVFQQSELCHTVARDWAQLFINSKIE